VGGEKAAVGVREITLVGELDGRDRVEVGVARSTDPPQPRIARANKEKINSSEDKRHKIWSLIPYQ